MQEHRKHLSDTRGNALGIGFFKVCMRLFGARCCCCFIWVVAFFYALFDREARRCAMPYVRSRFPEAAPPAAWWHLYRLLQNQGRAVFLAHWIRAGHQVRYEDVLLRNARHVVEYADRPFIMLLSHVGCWQASISRLRTLRRPVSLFIQSNLNPGIAQLVEECGMKLIRNTAPFGGMLECADALERGEIIAMTGDRMPPGAPHSLKMTLHGRAIDVPQFPWLLSARYGCPIIPVFTVMTERPDCFRLIYGPPVTVDFDLPRKPSPEVFAPYLERYREAFESIVEDYPYQIFHYDIT